jgi:hypothetical protein
VKIREKEKVEREKEKVEREKEQVKSKEWGTVQEDWPWLPYQGFHLKNPQPLHCKRLPGFLR